MRRGRVFILFAFVVLLGAIAVFVLLRLLSPPENGGGIVPLPSNQGQPSGRIVFAARDIPRGTLIAEEDVILYPFPSESIIDTMVSDPALVVGRYARMDIVRGIPLTINMVTQAPGDLLGTGSAAAVAIPPGFTAVSIPMDRFTGVAYALRAGDRVDVIAAMHVVDQDTEFQTILPNMTYVLSGPGLGDELLYLTASANLEPFPLGRVEVEPVTGQLLYVTPKEDQQPRLVTQRLLQNATVLHVGDFALDTGPAAAPAPAATPAPAGQTTAVTTAPDIITLIVTPQDALALHWALQSGSKVILTLRAPNDIAVTATTSVTLQYLLDNYSITIPTKLPFRMQPLPGLPVEPVLP